MKSLVVKVSSIAMLMAGLSSAPLGAEEVEVKGAVPTRADSNNADSTVYRASEVINLPVQNEEGSEVGRIKDLVINGESREVLYAVVAMNDGKEKNALYVMPWTVFQPSYGQNNAIQYTVLGLPQTAWMQAPYYSPAQWQQATFSQWAPRVNSYYADYIPVGGVANTRSTSVRVNKPTTSSDNVKGSAQPKAKSDAPAKNSEKLAVPSETEKPPRPCMRETLLETPGLRLRRCARRR